MKMVVGKEKKQKIKTPSWIHTLYKKYKKNQDELIQRKIEFLVDESYKYYLTLIINRIIDSKELDFHPAIYEAGLAINNEAKSLAEEVVIEIIKQGRNRINECFTKRFKEVKSAATKSVKKILVY